MNVSEHARRLVTIAAVLGALAGPGAAAQTPKDPRISVDVRLDRPWFAPGAPLAFDVEVSSRMKDPIPNLRVSVAVYERVRSRGELRRAFGGRLPRTPLHTMTYRLDADLEPQATRRLRVEQDLVSLPAFDDAPGGLYPISVTLRQSTGPALTSAVTAVALVPAPPQNALRVLPVLVLAPPPLVTADGQPTRSTRANLTGLRRRVQELTPPPAPFALAVSPALLDTLAALRTAPAVRAEAAGLEEDLRRLAEAVELVTLPYAHVQLPHLAELAGPDGLRTQLAEARAATRRLTGREPGPAFYPPDLALDARTLAALDDFDLERAIVSGRLVSAASGSLTPAEPVRAAGLDLLPADEGIGKALREARRDLDVGRVAAEIAMVYFESPGRQRTLVVDLAARLEAHRFQALLAQLAQAPFVSLTTPAQADVKPQTLRNLRYRQTTRPPRAFARSLEQARRAVGDFESFTLAGNPTRSALGDALRMGLGTAWWDDDWDRGSRWTRAITAAVRRQRSLVATTANPVTFTSRRGEIPITVVNHTGYPVRIRVEVESPKLQFPEGSARLLQPLEPPGRTLTFPALAEATGTFPLKVRLTSPDGSVLVHEEELVVRSTAFNVVALGITAGAGGFLVVWYGRKIAGRRKPREATAS